MKSVKPKTFLSNEIIEQQVIYDLIAYQKILKKPVEYPIDLDFYVKALWGLEVEYIDNLIFDNVDDIIGCLLVKMKIIQVNLFQNDSEGRTNFTIAHEAGHASLHSSLGLSSTASEIEDSIYCRKENENGTDTWRLEQQANHYASTLLMPKNKLFEEIDIDSVLNLNIEGVKLMEKFGVSRYFLELKLNKLGVNTDNNKYIFT